MPYETFAYAVVLQMGVLMSAGHGSSIRCALVPGGVRSLFRGLYLSYLDRRPPATILGSRKGKQ